MSLGDRAAFWGGALLSLFTVATAAGLLWWVFSLGAGLVSLDFLLTQVERSGREGGILDPLVSSLMLTGLSMAVAVPVGAGAGLYLSEYRRKGFGGKVLRLAVDSLAGIPSVVFGLFGLAVFVLRMGLGWSVLSGTLTLAAMMLPTLVVSTEAAARSVPQSYREASLALGATRRTTALRIVLPAAVPGIITGIALSLGRALGETAALIFTAGTSTGFPKSLADPARSLSVHLYLLAGEGLDAERAQASAAVLITLVLAANFLCWRVREHYEERSGSGDR